MLQAHGMTPSLEQTLKITNPAKMTGFASGLGGPESASFINKLDI